MTVADDLVAALVADLERILSGDRIYTSTMVHAESAPLTVERMYESILEALTGTKWRVHRHIPGTSVYSDGVERDTVWRFAPWALPEVTAETLTCNLKIAAKLVRTMRVPKDMIRDAGT